MKFSDLPGAQGQGNLIAGIVEVDNVKEHFQMPSHIELHYFVEAKYGKPWKKASYFLLDNSVEVRLNKKLCIIKEKSFT